MEESTPSWRSVARMLLRYESEGRLEGEGMVDATDRVCQKLRQTLARLVGTDAFDLVLARALRLARDGAPLLRGVEVQAGGCLEGLGAPGSLQRPEELTEACTALIGTFLGLVASFIGEDFVWRLVRNVWPEVPVGGVDQGPQEGEE